MAVINLPYGVAPKDEVPMFPSAAFAITPSNDDTFATPVSVYVGGAGTVRVIPFASAGEDSPTTVDFEVPAGGMIPVRVAAVLSTGTDATLLVGVY